MPRILLIDDDKEDAEIFQLALEEVNPTVSFYWSDGCEEVEHIIKRIPSPDIIFLDINMPAISGWDCLTQIKKKTELRNARVIMYTTSSRPAEKEIAKNLGADDFITKPNNYQLLKTMLESILLDVK